MKTNLLIYLILLSPFFCLAQEEPDTTYIPFVAYWSKGDTYNYKVTKILKKWINEEQVKNDSSSYVATFKVLDSTETNYTIQWSFETNLGDFQIPLSLLEEYPQYKTTKVIYTTDELGQFIEIKNWKKIAQSMKGLKKELAKSFAKKTGTDLETIEKELPFLDIYATKEGIEMLILQELMYLHSPFGAEYPADYPTYYEDLLPNLFGGSPIKASGKIYLQSYDLEKEYCTLIQELEADGKDVARALNEVYQHASPDKKALMKKAQLEMRDYNLFSCYYYPGVPTFIETKRYIKVYLGAVSSDGLNIIRIELLD